MTPRSHSSSKMDGATVRSICVPQDIVTEILLRLPVKTLLRFKSACKSWHALIESPRFDSLRRKLPLLTRSSVGVGCIRVYTPQNHLRSASLVVRNIATHKMEQELARELREIFNNSVIKPIPLFDRVTFVGPYHGVYLVRNRFENYVLWNHATRGYKILPRMDTTRTHELPDACGFGFEELADGGLDFLVVRVHKDWNSNARMPDLYKSSTGVWKQLKVPFPFPKEVWLNNSTEYINGVFYWKGWNLADHLDFLVSLDTRTEVFEEIDLPVSARAHGSLSCYDLDGNKFLSLIVSLKEELDVWVLKECDGRRSWVKEEIISYEAKSRSSERTDIAAHVWSATIQYEESLISLD